MSMKTVLSVFAVSALALAVTGLSMELPSGLRAARTVGEGAVREEPRPAPGNVLLGGTPLDTLICDDGGYGHWYLWESTWMAQGWDVDCPECPGEFMVTAAWFMTYTYARPGGFPRSGYIFADRTGFPGAILWSLVDGLKEHSWNSPTPGWERIKIDPPVEIPHGEKVWVGMNLRAQYPWWQTNRGPYFVMDELEPRHCFDVAWGPYWTDPNSYYVYPIAWYRAPSWAGDLMLRLEGRCKGPPDLDIDDDYANVGANVMHLIGCAGGVTVGAYVMAAPDSDLFNIDPWDGPGDCDIDTFTYLAPDLWVYGWEGNLEPPPWTRIPARNVNANLEGVKELHLGEYVRNFVQISIPEECGHGEGNVWDFQRMYHGIICVTGFCGEALDPCSDWDMFEVRVSVVNPSHGPKANGFWGVAEKESNVLYWNGLGFGQDGYNLYRAVGDKFVKLNASLLTGDSYSDKAVVDGEQYGYKLGLPFGDEREVLLGPIWVKRKINPSSYALYQNFPNPVRDETTIRYAITSDTEVSLQVHNIAGQVVATLVHEEQSPGFYAVSWRAKDVANGVYFYRLTAGEFAATKKLVVIR